MEFAIIREIQAQIIQIDIKHKDLGKLLVIAETFANELKLQLGDMVLGPQSPLIARIRNYYIQSIIIKMDWKNQSVSKIKSFLKDKVSLFEVDKINKGAFLVIDVDPY